MKVIVAGSRDINDYQVVRSHIELSHFEITQLISGGCKGVDTQGERYAIENNIPIKLFPADWDTHGRSAGPKRNREMAEYADALILIWDGESRGSMSMRTLARNNNLKIYTNI